MNKRLTSLQALLIVGFMATSPISFAQTAAQSVKAIPITPALKAESSFNLSGKITSIDEKAITFMTSDKVYYSLKLSQFKSPSELQTLKVKTGAAIKVNCKLGSINAIKLSEDTISIKPIESKASGITVVTKAIPAEKIQEATKPEMIQLTNAVSVVSDSKQPFELPFAVSVEMGGTVLQLK